MFESTHSENVEIHTTGPHLNGPIQTESFVHVADAPPICTACLYCRQLVGFLPASEAPMRSSDFGGSGRYLEMGCRV